MRGIIGVPRCYHGGVNLMSNYRFTTEYAIHVYLGGLMKLKVTKMAFAEPPSSDVATYCYCWSCFVPGQVYREIAVILVLYVKIAL